MSKPKITVALDTLNKAWAKLAPDAVFSEMTKEQFLAASEPSVATRSRISDLDQERKATLATRGASDEKTTELYQLVVNSIKGSPAHGEDSAIYRALGYKTKSERRSGLTRKARTQPESAAAK